MPKLKSFLKLDIMTVKPSLTWRELLFPVVGMLLMSVVMGSASNALMFGRVMGTMIVMATFIAADKCNLDSLYSILAIDRKTVVLGRYMFGILFNFLYIALSLVLLLVTSCTAEAFSVTVHLGGVYWMAFSTFIMFVIVQAIELPIMFKYGYGKARIVAMMPLMILGIAAMGASFVNHQDIFDIDTYDPELIVSLFSGNVVAIMAVVAVVSLVISYLLSVRFYNQREF